jgi:hypothetical protein
MSRVFDTCFDECWTLSPGALALLELGGWNCCSGCGHWETSDLIAMNMDLGETLEFFWYNSLDLIYLDNI